ncbi:hypothetical protein ONZ45_g12739 [Pleurotus djamor]|nr:hypothetical protein ONZ45_g12739 [Pleurotus djamor]
MTDPPTQPTFLPALKQMNITFKDSHSGRLFDSLELPLSASVTIFFAGLRRQDVQPILISALATRLYDGMLEIRLDLEADTLKISFVSEVDGGERSLTFPHYKDTTNIVSIFNDLPIETFTTLSLKVSSHIEVIEQLLRRFIRVKHLKIDKYSDKSLLMRLLQTDTRSPPPLRKLQSLSVDFFLAEHISVLWELLSERRDLDIPIQTISTEKSNEKHVSNLQEEFGVTIATLLWDDVDGLK